MSFCKLCDRTEADLLYNPCEDCGEYASEEQYARPLDFNSGADVKVYEPELTAFEDEEERD